MIVRDDDRARLEAIRRGSQSQPQALAAGADRAAVGGTAGGRRGGAARRRQPTGRVALATPVHRSGRGRPVAGQDPTAGDATVAGRDGRAGGDHDLCRAARRSYPLDRPGDGQASRHLAELGAADLGRARPSTAPSAHLQTLERSGIRREALRDIIGLYVDPPAHSLVLSVDEKSQIQALDRTQPGLPLKPGKCGTMSHDYKRHGTTTLFAALNVLDGRVIGRCMARHRHQEFIRFLNAVEREVPAGKGIHAILDNYGSHKHPKVRAWLARHPRWTFHFTPTSGSWLNAVETFFSTLTRRRLKRGVFRSIVELQAAINRYLAEHNQVSRPPPFSWTRSADTILDQLTTIPAPSV